MGLFEKKTVIFEKKDRDTWEQIRDVLKAEGFRGVHASHYFADTVSAGGCGAKLDPRAFGGKAVADRDIYRITVPAGDAQRAIDTIRRHGIVPVVDKNAATDAAVIRNKS